MADRTTGRGRGRASGSGPSHRGGRGGGGRSGVDARPKKDPILDLVRFVDQKIRVKYAGGREIVGVLKGHDALMNLVLDDTVEYLRDPENPSRLSGKTRSLGLIVSRGPALALLSPQDGSEAIENPFMVDA